MFMALPYSITSYKENSQKTRMEHVTLDLADQLSKSVAKSAAEDPASLFIHAVRYTPDSELCYPPGNVGDSLGLECEAETEYDHKIGRIPQFLPQIKCKSRVPPANVLYDLASFECKELMHLVPVMYQINETSHFKWRFTNISTGCIKVKKPYLMGERKSYFVISAKREQLSKHVIVMDDPDSLLTEVVRHTNHSGLCYPPERIGDSFGFDCEPKTVYDYKIDRIPQLLPQITCKNKFLAFSAHNNRISFKCQEVMHQVPVMYHSNDTIRFKWTFNRISTGCIKIKTKSLMVERKANSIVLEKIQ